MRLKEYFSSNPTTLTLIFTNIIIFIALNTFSNLSGLFLLDPSINMVMNRPWTLLTVFFSHELHIHILLNMFLVLIFGTQLERETNAKVVFYVYLLSGFIVFFASENSSYLQNIFLRHRWGILCVNPRSISF